MKLCKSVLNILLEYQNKKREPFIILLKQTQKESEKFLLRRREYKLFFI